MNKQDVASFFQLAGFHVKKTWELANLYWPDHPDYNDVRDSWWLVLTEVGLIRIGGRKRVFEIDWSSTTLRGKVTTDEVTQEDTLVHAWTKEKVLEYLTALRKLPPKNEDVAKRFIEFLQDEAKAVEGWARKDALHKAAFRMKQTFLPEEEWYK